MSVALVILGCGWAVLLVMVSVMAGSMTDEETFQRARSGRGSWIVALAVAFTLAAIGLILWGPLAGDAGNADSDLGSALLGGVIAGFAVLFLQWRFEIEARERDKAALKAQKLRDEAAAAERRRQDDRQHAQILTALHDDLTGVDLRARDLSSFYLRGRRLKHAKLDGADLSGANLAFANLKGAGLAGAKLGQSAYLEAVFLHGADLEGARLATAYLAGADLTNANLANADLAQTDLSETDLRGCDLSGIRNVNSATFADARYDKETTWTPPGAPNGAIEVETEDPWQCAAAIAQAQ
jgi:hypothetical protein